MPSALFFPEFHKKDIAAGVLPHRAGCETTIKIVDLPGVSPVYTQAAKYLFASLKI